MAPEEDKDSVRASKRISDLEDQYVSLLESKVAHLQSQLSSGKFELSGGNNDAFGDGLDGSATKSSFAVHDDTVAPKSSTKPAEDAKNGGDESRYRVIIRQWDPRNGEFQDVSSGIKDKTYGPVKKPKQAAFTFRKLIGLRTTRSDDRSTSSEVDIHFQPLQKLLGSLTSRYGWSDEVTGCSAPYSALIYSWSDAEREARKIDHDESNHLKLARDDLRELLRLISTSSGDVLLDRYFKERETRMEEEAITHAALWTLFPPGTLVLGKPCHDEPQVFFVESCNKFVSEDEDFEILLHSFDWNGSYFSRVPFNMAIPAWGGDRKRIIELPFYPLSFYGKEGMSREQAITKLKTDLIARGRDYRKFCIAERGQQMFNYSDGVAYFNRHGGFLEAKEVNTGLNFDSRRSGSSTRSDNKKASTSHSWASWKSTAGAMIVDFASYMTYQPTGSPILGPFCQYEGHVTELSPERQVKKMFQDIYRFSWDGYQAKLEPNDEQLLCCSPHVLGYALKQKTWVQLLVKYLGEPKEADLQTFNEKLQLDEDAKALISNSVKAHEKVKKREDGRSKGLEDFAPGKGKGLVIMLYGLPGVGKTLTAESVAQMTGKPLLSVGVSDIGIEGGKVEANLEKIFALAGLWEAVLLFDEADVFLESRGEGDNDLRRNAMVSVLLRVLEYYDGILILTTNRMRSLDIAVQSLIHLAVKFNALQPEQKISIFTSFLEQLPNKGLIDDYTNLQDWVKKESKRFEFNGRQIRNVISTALGIAMAQDRKLDREDLANVARQTDEFKRDLRGQEAIYEDRQIKSHS